MEKNNGNYGYQPTSGNEQRGHQPTSTTPNSGHQPTTSTTTQPPNVGTAVQSSKNQ